MSRLVDLHEGQVTRSSDITVVLAILLASYGELLHLRGGEFLVAWPVKSISPGVVAKPVADKVCVASVDEDWNLLENAWNEAVEWFHPVTSKEEVAINVEVAGIKAIDLGTNSFEGCWFVEKLGNRAEAGVTEVAGVFTWSADVVNVLSSTLVWAYHGIIAVDGSRNARPNALAIVAALNE